MLKAGTLLKTDYTVPFYAENWKESSFLDVHIVCADGDCWAHKLAMIHASQFVGFTLDDQFPGEQTTLILPDVSLAVMELLLDLIYTGAADVPEGLMDTVEETMRFLHWIQLDKVTKTESQLQSHQTPTQASGSSDFLSPISFGGNSYKLDGMDNLLSDEELGEPAKQSPPVVDNLEGPLVAAPGLEDNIAETIPALFVRTRYCKVEVRSIAVQVPEIEELKELPQADGPLVVNGYVAVSAPAIQDTPQQMDITDDVDHTAVLPEVERIDDGHEHTGDDCQMSDDEPLDLSTESLKPDEPLEAAAPTGIHEDEDQDVNVIDDIEQMVNTINMQPDENCPSAAAASRAPEKDHQKPAKRARGRPPKAGLERKKGILSRGVALKGWFDSSQEMSQDNDFRDVKKRRAARRMKDWNGNQNTYQEDLSHSSRVTRLRRKSTIKSEPSTSVNVLNSDNHQFDEDKQSATSFGTTPINTSTANGSLRDENTAMEKVEKLTPVLVVPSITEEKIFDFILDDMNVENRAGHFQASVSYISGHQYDGLLLPSKVISVVDHISPSKVWPYLKRLKIKNNMVVSILLIKPTESLHSDFNPYFNTLVHETDRLENRSQVRGEDFDSVGQLGVLGVTKPFKYCYLLPYAIDFVLPPVLQAHCPNPIVLPENVEKCFLAIVIRKDICSGSDSSSPNASKATTSNRKATPNDKKRVTLLFKSPPSSVKRPRRSSSATLSSQEQEDGHPN